VVVDILGAEFAGVMNLACFLAYDVKALDDWLKQKCVGHLLRNLSEMEASKARGAVRFARNRTTVQAGIGTAMVADELPDGGLQITMTQLRIGLLSKRRGNFAIQEKFVGADNVVDETDAEVAHHEQALTRAGHSVRRIRWGPDFVKALQDAQVDLVFNVSSMVEAAILEELEIPYVGSDTFAIAVATDKSLAKRLWQQVGLPTSPFRVVRSEKDCEAFQDNPPFEYPLFIKPVAGRGSAGINDASVVHSYDQLVGGVVERLEAIGQPVLVERFLQGREITLGVLGNGDARVLPPLEIVYREGDVTLTFEKKELDDDSFLCPAPLAAEQTQMMQQLALYAYHALKLKDFGRIDTVLTEEGPFLLEANTFAGLMCTPKEKPHSYIGFMARAEGKDGQGLLDEIIQSAVKRLNLKVRE
jgi:D-alanine-D-alanine ligase